MKRSVWYLSIGTFAIGTDTFVIAGVLPTIAEDLHTSVGQTGQLITVYALSLGVLAPILGTLTAQRPRKQLLLWALMLFGLGNAFSALAPTFELLLLSRVVAGAGAALYTPTAAAAAVSMVSEAERGRALATVLGGATVATVMGVPLATLIGVEWDWRAAFGAVCAVAVVAALTLAITLPHPPVLPVPTLRERLRLLRDRRILPIIVTTFLFFAGGFAVYTYVAVVLDVDHVHLVLALLVFGVAGVCGNYLGGWATDRFGPQVVLLWGLAAFAAALALLPAAHGHYGAELIVLAMWALAAWTLTVPQQHRLIATVPQLAQVAVGLNSAAVFIGIGLAGSIGAWGISLVGTDQLPYLGSAIVVVALLVAAGQIRLSEQRTSNESAGLSPS